MARDAQYVIVKQSDHELVIEDVGDWTRVLTITNDAEGVVRRLHASGSLGARRLFYRDSENKMDELLHDGAGVFAGYGPGPDA